MLVVLSFFTKRKLNNLKFDMENKIGELRKKITIKVGKHFLPQQFISRSLKLILQRSMIRGRISMSCSKAVSLVLKIPSQSRELVAREWFDSQMYTHLNKAISLTGIISRYILCSSGFGFIPITP